MKSLKIHLDLNNKQTTLCRQHAGVAGMPDHRHAYNWGVAECQKAFDSNQKIPSAIELHKRLVAEVKTLYHWYYEVSNGAARAVRAPTSPQKPSFGLSRLSLDSEAVGP